MAVKKSEDQFRVLLVETILAMCRNTLNYDSEVSVEGLIGITLDKEEIFLVTINQLISNPDAVSSTGKRKRKRKRKSKQSQESNSDDSDNQSGTEDESRKRSRQQSGQSDHSSRKDKDDKEHSKSAKSGRDRKNGDDDLVFLKEEPGANSSGQDASQSSYSFPNVSEALSSGSQSAGQSAGHSRTMHHSVDMGQQQQHQQHQQHQQQRDGQYMSSPMSRQDHPIAGTSQDGAASTSTSSPEKLSRKPPEGRGSHGSSSSRQLLTPTSSNSSSSATSREVARPSTLELGAPSMSSKDRAFKMGYLMAKQMLAQRRAAGLVSPGSEGSPGGWPSMLGLTPSPSSENPPPFILTSPSGDRPSPMQYFAGAGRTPEFTVPMGMKLGTPSPSIDMPTPLIIGPHTPSPSKPGSVGSFSNPSTPTSNSNRPMLMSPSEPPGDDIPSTTGGVVYDYSKASLDQRERSEGRDLRDTQISSSGQPMTKSPSMTLLPGPLSIKHKLPSPGHTLPSPGHHHKLPSPSIHHIHGFPSPGRHSLPSPHGLPSPVRTGMPSPSHAIPSPVGLYDSPSPMTRAVPSPQSLSPNQQHQQPHGRSGTSPKPYSPRSRSLSPGAGSSQRIHCVVCQREQKSIQHLISHLHNHGTTAKLSGPARCPICNHECTELRQYKSHLITHTGSPTHACPLCEKKFSTEFGVRQHLHQLHWVNPPDDVGRWSAPPASQVERYFCYQCKVSCGDPDEFEKHLYVSHSDQIASKKFGKKCELCESFFLGLQGLRQHLRISHNMTIEAYEEDLRRRKTPDKDKGEAERLAKRRMSLEAYEYLVKRKELVEKDDTKESETTDGGQDIRSVIKKRLEIERLHRKQRREEKRKGVKGGSDSEDEKSVTSPEILEIAPTKEEREEKREEPQTDKKAERNKDLDKAD